MVDEGVFVFLLVSSALTIRSFDLDRTVWKRSAGWEEGGERSLCGSGHMGRVFHCLFFMLHLVEFCGDGVFLFVLLYYLWCWKWDLWREGGWVVSGMGGWGFEVETAKYSVCLRS
jgi:hypothetical protein